MPMADRGIRVFLTRIKAQQQADQPGARKPAMHFLRTFPALCLLLLLPPAALGRYNLKTCWGSGEDEWCIERNAQGKWCFAAVKGYRGVAGQISRCDEEESHNSPDFTLVMNTHLQQNRSIAYYNGADNQVIGGPEWPVPENPGSTRICISTIGADGWGVSACTLAAKDNEWPVGSIWCAVQTIPTNVTDGCYDAAGGFKGFGNGSANANPCIGRDSRCYGNDQRYPSPGEQTVPGTWTLRFVLFCFLVIACLN